MSNTLTRRGLLFDFLLRGGCALVVLIVLVLDLDDEQPADFWTWFGLFAFVALSLVTAAAGQRLARHHRTDND